MAFAKRIVLFLLVNILVLTTISIVMAVFNVQPYLTQNGINYTNLMIFCLIWGFTGAFISLAMSRMMAKWMMGVKLIAPDTQEENTRWLVNTVHSLARRAGLSTMPQVGWYESPEVNAFATGPSKSRSLVAVSTGILNRMDRNQLEGVLAHEITHISNGDMFTLTLIQGVVNAFVMFFARIIAFAIAQNVREDMRFMVRFAVTIVLDILLGILGSMVVAYFSRIREYRADAGGARLAGREKMVGALQSLMSTTQLIDTQHASMASMKISGGGGFWALLATHPPLEDRIQRLKSGMAL